MELLQLIAAPVLRLFRALRLVSEQTYCGDSSHCVGLTYHNGNLQQLIPVRVRSWNACPVKEPYDR